MATVRNCAASSRRATLTSFANFDEQDRLLNEIHAGVRALDILEGDLDLEGNQTGVRNAVLPAVARLIASE